MVEQFGPFLKKAAQSLYSFSFALIPDDLQAYQMALDSIGAYLIELKEDEKLADLLKAKLTPLDLKFHRLNLYQKCFALGIKRHRQITYDSQSAMIKEHQYYYALEVKQRAALFLKHKLSFSLEDMTFITLYPKIELISLLQTARANITINIQRNEDMNKTPSSSYTQQDRSHETESLREKRQP